MGAAKQIDIISNILGKSKKKNSNNKITSKKTNRHIWTIEEENICLDLYFKNASIAQIKEAIKDTDLKYNSVLMKLENIKFLDTGEGLENVSSLTKQLFELRKGETSCQNSIE